MEAQGAEPGPLAWKGRAGSPVQDRPRGADLSGGWGSPSSCTVFLPHLCHRLPVELRTSHGPSLMGFWEKAGKMMQAPNAST